MLQSKLDHCFGVVLQVAFCAVDCTVYQNLCTQNDVTGYPTLKYFNYGKNPQNYMGGREVRYYQCIRCRHTCIIPCIVSTQYGLVSQTIHVLVQISLCSYAGYNNFLLVLLCAVQIPSNLKLSLTKSESQNCA